MKRIEYVSRISTSAPSQAYRSNHVTNILQRPIEAATITLKELEDDGQLHGLGTRRIVDDVDNSEPQCTINISTFHSSA
jgi:hypothetical protein